MQEPTNSEILRAVEAIDRKFTPLVEDLDRRVKGTEGYISDQKAVAAYVAANGTHAQKAAIPQPVSTDESAKSNVLAKTIVVIFGFFTVVIGLITTIINSFMAK